MTKIKGKNMKDMIKRIKRWLPVGLVAATFGLMMPSCAPGMYCGDCYYSEYPNPNHHHHHKPPKPPKPPKPHKPNKPNKPNKPSKPNKPGKPGDKNDHRGHR